MNNTLDILAHKYSTDKKIASGCHGYTKIYFELLNEKRDEMQKIMEIGVRMGGSLRMWRDFFPLAQVYGLDNHKELLFETDRIKCFYAEQNDEATLQEAIKNIGADFDLIVDDGSHELAHQLSSFKIFFPIIKTGGIYAIEDVSIKTLDEVRRALTGLNYTIYSSQISSITYFLIIIVK